MIKSMTGYGKQTLETSIGQITIEIRAVNNRYIEVYQNLPDFLNSSELKLVNKVKNFLKRGSINLTIEVEEFEEGREILNFNPKKLKNIFASLKDIKYTLDLDDDVKIADILNFSNKFMEEEDIKTDQIYAAIKEELDNTLQQVDDMRIEEGKTLYSKINEYVSKVEECVNQVVDHSVNIKENLYQQYKQDIKDLLDDSDIEDDRILQEAAILAKKVDITEECDRIKSHIGQFKKYMDAEGLTGKKLNFLAQEMHRELNTIGAKSNNSDISHIIVEAKNEIEKIKEQIRNIL